jgi:hypothetical protein
MMREVAQVGRREKRRDWLLAGAGCLILLLAGCAPAVMLTKNYIDNSGESDDPSQVYPVSANQVPPDQTPLLTTKSYKDTTGNARESTQVYRATLDQVWAAALKALGELKASVVNSTRDGVGGEIEGLWVGGQLFTMYVDQTGASTIRVKIRVGQFGEDQGAENAIQAKIGENL